MDRKRVRWQAAALAVAIALATSGTTAQTRQAPSSSKAASTVFSADVVIDDTIVDASGALVESRPQTRYRLSTRQVDGDLETEIVYGPARLFPRGPLVDPRSGYRLVFDSQLRNPQVYDAAGQLISRPAGPPPIHPGPTSAAARPGLVLSDRDAPSRRDHLVQGFGPAVGTVGGRDRYLVQDGEVMTETLVDPGAVLPVEVNVVRSGKLDHRTSIAYGRLPGRRWYVASVRSERALPGAKGRRFVTSRTHLNVVAREEGQP